MEPKSPGPAKIARKLIRECDRATLSTSMAEGGWPYGSLVMTACDPAARPLVLISDLAEHTRNLAADSRAALLFDGTAGLASPLTGARVTVLGRLLRIDDPALTARYAARHPEAELYLGFADFHLYGMAVERAHIVAGFGEIHWIPADALILDISSCATLAEAEPGILDHMNADHGDAVRLYATALLGLPDGDWAMTGIDPEGVDLRNGGTVARLSFDDRAHGPVADGGSARAALVALAQAARAVQSR
ncbi:MAG: DUF2470 domain-containing protein [Rhodospirillaceae bacterium]